jgi:hypothetical protein
MKTNPLLSSSCWWSVLLAVTLLVGCGGGGGGGGGGTVPAAPSDIQATLVTADSARLSWTDNADNEEGFEIGVCGGAAAIDAGGTYCAAGWLPEAQTQENFHDLTGLATDQGHSYYVRAYNAAGASNAYLVDFVTSAVPLTTVTFSAALDNTLKQFLPDDASPATDDLGVGCIWDNGSELCTASLVRFDLASLVAGTTIERATLRLAVGPQLVVGSSPRNWQVTPVAETSWDAAVTWNTAVNSLTYRDLESVVLAPPDFAGQALAIDVTAIVQNWVDGSWANNGVLLELIDYSQPTAQPGNGWGFVSHDFNFIVDLGPRLTVVHQ